MISKSFTGIIQKIKSVEKNSPSGIRWKSLFEYFKILSESYRYIQDRKSNSSDLRNNYKKNKKTQNEEKNKKTKKTHKDFEELNEDKDITPEEFASKFVQAVTIAEVEPYRAVTHNKGIMNGIDAVVLATGNDFRAVEAGVHAYASRNGKYSSLTHAKIENDIFTFWMEIPLALGTVGGLTSLHPLVKMALEILGKYGNLASICTIWGDFKFPQVVPNLASMGCWIQLRFDVPKAMHQRAR